MSARIERIALLCVAVLLMVGCSSRMQNNEGVPASQPVRRFHVEQRDMPAFLRGPYNQAFFFRHYEPYTFSAAIHFAHGKAHDVPQLTPLSRSDYYDASFNAEAERMAYDPPHSEPSMMYFGPYTGRFAWNLYRAIDWTHVHHEQTYDIMSSPKVSWNRKKQFTDRAVKAYLDRMKDTARSIAPLDITMRRAGTMMKPYFSYFRNYYPKSNDFFFLAHWWHPVIYEAQMIGGNDQEQDVAVRQTHELTFTQVMEDRPRRMLLSREAMPRYSRMSPESANIFDNLHMLHGIAYDILSYEGWSEDQKRAELYRVIDAMSYQPGDERYVRKFSLPYPEMDPRIYYDWMKPYEGEMNRIMEEMMREMWPLMDPQGRPEPPPEVLAQLRLKLTPGMQEGEDPGSLHDAISKIVPGLKMDPAGMQPGNSPGPMIRAMLEGWQRKYGDMPDAPGIEMSSEPDLPPMPVTQPATGLRN